MLSEKGFKDKYGPRAREVKYGELQTFIDEMFAEELDYGTVCYAVALAAVAAAWSANKHPTQGGITGSQSGFVLWEFIRGWDQSRIGELGARLVNYDDMLYPQMGDRFAWTINAEQHEKLQAMAQEKLSGDVEYVHKKVLEHWQSIVDGELPHGFKIKE